MKNSQFERARQSAKCYVKRWASNRKLTERGNYVVHHFDGTPRLSWWGDVFFRLGSQVVAVWWTHPRLQYHDACENAAFDQVDELRAHKSNAAVPLYKIVGKNKNRKKVVAWRLKETPEEQRKWRDEWKRIKEHLLKTSDVIVRPSMTIKQYDWCRGVEICLPIEIIDQRGLEDVADIVRSILSGKKKFEDFYPVDYAYGRDEWAVDQAKFEEVRGI